MEFLANSVADSIIYVASLAGEFWVNLQFSNVTWWQAVLDILLVTVVLYYIFALLRGSRAVKVLLGLIVISVVFIISKSLNLLTLGWLLDSFFTMVLVAIPIIFQKELRMALEKLGQNPFFGGNGVSVELDAFINDLVETCAILANNKVGALIVLEGQIPLKEYIDSGVRIDGESSRELLISVFQGKGPLHDGAVILKGRRVVAASCLLPTSFEAMDSELGTRHKAAIGVTEHTDAAAIVVSEERGTISFARGGRLERAIEPARLEELLWAVISPKKRRS